MNLEDDLNKLMMPYKVLKGVDSLVESYLASIKYTTENYDGVVEYPLAVHEFLLNVFLKEI